MRTRIYWDDVLIYVLFGMAILGLFGYGIYCQLSNDNLIRDVAEESAVAVAGGKGGEEAVLAVAARQGAELSRIGGVLVLTCDDGDGVATVSVRYHGPFPSSATASAHCEVD